MACGRLAGPIVDLIRLQIAAGGRRTALLGSDGTAAVYGHLTVFVGDLTYVRDAAEEGCTARCRSEVAAAGRGTPCPRATAPPWAAAAPWVSSQTCPACESLLEDTARPCSGDGAAAAPG